MSFEFKEFSTYENERWKNILIDGEHTDYFISNYGKILSFKKSQPYILKNNIVDESYDEDNYLYDITIRITEEQYYSIKEFLKETK